MQSYSASRFLPKCSGKQERLGDAVEHVLFGLRRRKIRIQEMLARMLRRLHQVGDTIGPNGLYEIRADGLQLHGRDPPCRTKGLRKMQSDAVHCKWSMRNVAKARIVIVGVETAFRAGRWLTTADDPARAAVARTRVCGRCIRGSSRAVVRAAAVRDCRTPIRPCRRERARPTSIRRRVCWASIGNAAELTAAMASGASPRRRLVRCASDTFDAPNSTAKTAANQTKTPG